LDNVLIYCAYMAMAAFIAWTLFRGVKTGVLAGENYRYHRDAQPLGFALSFALRILVIGFCLAGMGHALGLNSDPMATLRKALGPFA
jgi:hypothetical protein